MVYQVTSVNLTTGKDHKTINCKSRQEALKIEIAFNVATFTNENLIAEAREDGVKIINPVNLQEE